MNNHAEPKPSQESAEPAGPDSERVSSGAVGYFAENRPFVYSALASLALHASIAALGIALKPAEVEFTFESSQGVAIMSRLGYAPPENLEELLNRPAEETEEGSGETDEAEAPEVAAVVEPEPEPPPEEPPPQVEPTPEENPEETEAPEPTPPEEAEPERTEPEPERPRSPREPEPSEAAEPRRPAVVRDSRGNPDASVPPAERYPEGTVNPIATDIGMWGPEGAQSVMIVRMDRIRQSVHRANFESIMKTLPDWDSLIGRSSISPVDDVDAMLISSSDVRYVNQTFVAAVHHLDPGHVLFQLQEGYPRGIRWEQRRDGRYLGTPVASSAADPRVFFVPTGNMFIFTRTEFLEPLLEDAPRASGLRGSMDTLRELTDAERAAEAAAAAAAANPAPTGSAATGAAPTAGGLRPVIRGTSGAASPTTRGARPSPTNLAPVPRLPIRGTNAAPTNAVPRAGAATATAPQAGVQTGRPATQDVSAVADDAPPVRSDGWISGLLGIADFGGVGLEGPAIDWTFNGIQTLQLAGMGRAQPPKTIHSTLTLSTDPIFQGRMVFPSQADAEKWVDVWPAIVGAYNLQLRLAGLYQALSTTQWTIDHNEAVFHMTIPAASVGVLATWASGMR